MDKKPVKVRLAEKYALDQTSKVRAANGIIKALNEERDKALTECLIRHEVVHPEQVAAYVAGFDRAKLLCVDAVRRFADEFVPPDGTGKKLSEHINTIGEMP